MNKRKGEKERPAAKLGIEGYDGFFEALEPGKTVNLKDSKSERSAHIPVKTVEEGFYVAQPDGGLIPAMPGQQKCDYLVCSLQYKQSCFFELKGTNISMHKDYNPYDQIWNTVRYLKENEKLKVLVELNQEKHAFIVSNENQRIPKGSESKERDLWKRLAGMCDPQIRKAQISDLVHYVKVVPSSRYSNNNGRIICSSKEPIQIPFKME